MSATPANVPTSGPNVTFSAPSNPLSFNPTDDSAIYTLGTWLASASATGISYNAGAAPTDGLDNTIWNFTGDVSVTTGEMFTVSHDDGVTLIIDGVTVVDEPGPTSAVTTSYTWTGPSGTFAFQLVYGECCGPPAQLVTSLPLSSTIPEPSTWAMMLIGFGGLGFFGFRRLRKGDSIISA